MINLSFIALRNQFQSYCKDKGYSKTPTYQHVLKSVRFMDYLASQNITSCKKINLPLIHAYIKTNTTIGYEIFCIRTFLQFLLETGEIQTDFAAKIPMVQLRKQTHILSVWTKDELQKLIAAMDRVSPKGRRDYAIILLACCLGRGALTLKILSWQ